jgi:F-type H+-transporting ATPase subunit delta
MKKNSILAKRYAKALFEMALENGILDRVNADMELVANVVSENRELRQLMVNPVVTSLRKQKIFKSVFEKHLDKLSISFLNILIRKGREYEVPEIAHQYLQLFLEHKNIVVAEIVTAIAVNEETSNRIKNLVANLTKKEISVKSKIDPAIIGGFKINMEDYQYDASIRKVIDNMHKEFDKNLFIKRI